MVDNATWNDGRRHFWASNEDYTEMLAGEKDSEEFYSAVHQETKFGFVVLAGYDEAYFDEYAYPETKAYVVISAAIVLVVGLFALGTCTIAFHRSSRK